jgi:hypothetical protein
MEIVVNDHARTTLAEAIRSALESADTLQLTDVGISLDRALVQLTGRGAAMSEPQTVH